MSKFDVNKIIEESLRETTSKEASSEVEPLEVMKGWYGSKLYDRLHKTPTPEEALGEKQFQIARKYRAAVNSGDTEGARIARQQLKGIRSVAAPVDKEASSEVEADELKKVSKISKAAAKEVDTAWNKEAADAGVPAKTAPGAVATKVAEQPAPVADVAKKAAVDAPAAAPAKNTEDTTSVLSHLGKSARKVGDDIQSGVKSFGHKVADHLSNLDYGKTALASGAIAAGLGALALRRRMKNAKRE